jgi:hypothetical protein
MDEAPLGYMMDSLIVDHQGRTTARKDSLLNLKGEALNMALEVETFLTPLTLIGHFEFRHLLNQHECRFSTTTSRRSMTCSLS